MVYSEHTLKNVAILVRKEFDFYYNRYNEKKYPPEVYSKGQRDFSSLKASTDSVKGLLIWKYGNTGKENFPNSHKQIMDDAAEAWKVFVNSNAVGSAQETFKWWRAYNEGRFPFITAAFISHLVWSDELVTIIDQHNFRAMNYLLLMADSSYPRGKKKPSNWSDIHQLNIFVKSLSELLDRKYSDLDRFLMEYGKAKKQYFR